jgi:hypothetical protein
MKITSGKVEGKNLKMLSEQWLRQLDQIEADWRLHEKQEYSVSRESRPLEVLRCFLNIDVPFIGHSFSLEASRYRSTERQLVL